MLVGAGLRWGQVKTMVSLRLKVALCALVHNLKFSVLSGQPSGCQSVFAVIPSAGL